MHEAEILCDRIVILHRGHVVAAGAPRELIARETPGFVAIFAEDHETALRAHVAKDWILFRQGRQCCVRAPSIDDLVALQHRAALTALQLRPANLEDVYLKLTGQQLDHDE